MDLPGEAREYIADLLDIEEEETRGEAVEWVTDYDALGLGPDSGKTRSSGPALWYPEATTTLKMPSRGTYPRNYPIGAVVHFTAGRCEKGDADAENTIRYGAHPDRRHSYFCISSTGRIYQTAPLSHWGSHAGKSSYPGLGEFLSSKLVGIEVCGAGIVRKTDLGYEPGWNNYASQKTYYTEDQVRRVAKTANITQAGYYLKYTPAQEEALLSLLRWLQANHPSVFQFKYVLGHDEISPTRKQDPGGSLSLLMPELRDRLASPPTLVSVPAVPAPPAVPAAPASPRAGNDPEEETLTGFRVSDLFVSRSRSAPRSTTTAQPASTGTRGAPASTRSAGGAMMSGAVGAFVTPQSVVSFPIATGVVVGLTKLAEGFQLPVNPLHVTLGGAALVGLLIFLITLSNEEARPRTGLQWTIAILMALINTAFLAGSASGLAHFLPGETPVAPDPL